MKNDTRAVWDCYVSSWNAESGAERRALFADCLAPDCVYRDPHSVARGWDELGETMANFHGRLPGAHFVTTHFWDHHGRCGARWQLLSAADVALGEGISYGEYDGQQRLVAMNAFFDTSESRASA